MLFPYFVYIAHLKNSHKEVLCPWKNLCSSKNQKQKKVLGKKKEEKKSSTLASIFRTKKSSSNQNLPCITLKTRSSFIYANTSLDTNCILIRCLAPQHIFLFFDSSLWQLCPLICRPPQCSIERLREI